jgi:hypothetical protein
MGMHDRLAPARRAIALLLLSLSLIVAGAALSGCAAGSAGDAGGASFASFPECMSPSNPLPWWQTYPCSTMGGGGGGGGGGM